MAVRSCALVTSSAVLRELARGCSDQAGKRIELMGQLELLEPGDEISVAAGVYIQQKLMPQDVEGDALHLALASHHKCDALATRNYHDLANPNKLDWIRRLNGELGLAVPRIATPRQLMEGMIMAEHGNDWRKVLQWHVEQDRLYAQQNGDAAKAAIQDESAAVSGR